MSVLQEEMLDLATELRSLSFANTIMLASVVIDSIEGLEQFDGEITADNLARAISIAAIRLARGEFNFADDEESEDYGTVENDELPEGF